MTDHRIVEVRHVHQFDSDQFAQLVALIAGEKVAPPRAAAPSVPTPEEVDPEDGSGGDELLHGWESTAARLGGIGRTMVFSLWRTGELESVTIGSRRFSTTAQIEQYIARLVSA